MWCVATPRRFATQTCYSYQIHHRRRDATPLSTQCIKYGYRIFFFFFFFPPEFASVTIPIRDTKIGMKRSLTKPFFCLILLFLFENVFFFFFYSHPRITYLISHVYKREEKEKKKKDI